MATKQKVTVKFVKEKETKNTVKYREDNDTDERDTIGSIYVKKSVAADLGDPEEITVTIS